ncbi:MAG TPA: hypothetical protein VGP41_07790 [Candidatus Lustribacter sp.]|jgi:4-carboxymuconolactone decarboxylase|nr:hypothetical protein [Candidatus Lustribacter sp.]
MAQDSSLIAEIAPEALTPDQAAILAAVEKGRGFVPRPFKVWLHNPTLAVPMEALGTYLNTSSSLSVREYEIAVVVVARRVASAFPLHAHLRNLEKAGHPKEVVEALRDGRAPTLASEREAVIYEIARTSNDPEPTSDELFERAVAALGRNGLADVIALIGYYTGVCLAMKLHRVPPG